MNIAVFSQATFWLFMLVSPEHGANGAKRSWLAPITDAMSCPHKIAAYLCVVVGWNFGLKPHGKQKETRLWHRITTFNHDMDVFEKVLKRDTLKMIHQLKFWWTHNNDQSLFGGSRGTTLWRVPRKTFLWQFIRTFDKNIYRYTHSYYNIIIYVTEIKHNLPYIYIWYMYIYNIIYIYK